jgi:hypothetical protein
MDSRRNQPPLSAVPASLTTPTERRDSLQGGQQLSASHGHAPNALRAETANQRLLPLPVIREQHAGAGASHGTRQVDLPGVIQQPGNPPNSAAPAFGWGSERLHRIQMQAQDHARDQAAVRSLRPFGPVQERAASRSREPINTARSASYNSETHPTSYNHGPQPSYNHGAPGSSMLCVRGSSSDELYFVDPSRPNVYVPAPASYVGGPPPASYAKPTLPAPYVGGPPPAPNLYVTAPASYLVRPPTVPYPYEAPPAPYVHENPSAPYNDGAQPASHDTLMDELDVALYGTTLTASLTSHPEPNLPLHREPHSHGQSLTPLASAPATLPVPLTRDEVAEDNLRSQQLVWLTAGPDRSSGADTAGDLNAGGDGETGGVKNAQGEENAQRDENAPGNENAQEEENAQRDEHINQIKDDADEQDLEEGEILEEGKIYEGEAEEFRTLFKS